MGSCRGLRKVWVCAKWKVKCRAEKKLKDFQLCVSQVLSSFKREEHKKGPAWGL